MADLSKPRPGENMRLIEALQYKLPVAGVVSILHRVSGMLMFFLLPLVIWLFDTSVTSEVSFDRFASAFTAGFGWWMPGFAVKLLVLGLIWAYLHHAIAGVRQSRPSDAAEKRNLEARLNELSTRHENTLLELNS